MSRPFYEKAGGLRFACTGCGHCCTRPGPVYLPPPDLRRAAAHLGLAPAAFRLRYKVKRLNGMAALDPPDDAACPFWSEAGGCAIYEARPTQCRTFPFWPEVVRRARRWADAARECEGMNQGELHPPAVIRSALVELETLGVPEGEP